MCVCVHVLICSYFSFIFSFPSVSCYCSRACAQKVNGASQNPWGCCQAVPLLSRRKLFPPHTRGGVSQVPNQQAEPAPVHLCRLECHCPVERLGFCPRHALRRSTSSSAFRQLPPDMGSECCQPLHFLLEIKCQEVLNFRYLKQFVIESCIKFFLKCFANPF